jgi:glycyl-tRNA synthetase beta chain
MDRELLIEIGCEEIPASWLPGLTSQLASHLDARLKEARLTTDRPTESYSTPRRLTARIAKLAERQTDHEELVTGPPISAAYMPDGEPTAGGDWFAQKHGVEVARLERSQTPEGHLPRVSGASTRQGDRRRARRRARAACCATSTFPKQMRWDAYLRGRQGRSRVRAADPLADSCLYGGPRGSLRHPAHRDGARARSSRTFRSGPNTYGHRFLTTSGRAGRAIKVKTFEDYEARLLENFVILNRSERESKIRRELETHARKARGAGQRPRGGAVVAAAGGPRSG